LGSLTVHHRHSVTSDYRVAERCWVEREHKGTGRWFRKAVWGV